MHGGRFSRFPRVCSDEQALETTRQNYPASGLSVLLAGAVLFMRITPD